MVKNSQINLTEKQHSLLYIETFKHQKSLLHLFKQDRFLPKARKNFNIPEYVIGSRGLDYQGVSKVKFEGEAMEGFDHSDSFVIKLKNPSFLAHQGWAHFLINLNLDFYHWCEALIVIQDKISGEERVILVAPSTAELTDLDLKTLYVHAPQVLDELNIVAVYPIMNIAYETEASDFAQKGLGWIEAAQRSLRPALDSAS